MAVLITAAANSAAFRLERILETPEVYFADQSSLPSIPGKKFLKIPDASSNSFTHEVLKICLDHHIIEIYPLRGEEMTELSRSRQLFEEFGISLVIPSEQWIENKLNVSSSRSSDIIVLVNGRIRAGKLPAGFSLPENEEFGVFEWMLEGREIRYRLYKVENAEL